MCVCQSFCYSHSPKKVNNPQKTLIFGTTLDSLQGVWYPKDDRNSGYATISGHDFVVYTGTEPNQNFKIYFSDTLITEDDWTHVSNVNLNATSGIYLLLVSTDGDNSVSCYEFGAVADNGTTQTFGMSETKTPYHTIIYER